jgi:hypothetical protein
MDRSRSFALLAALFLQLSVRADEGLPPQDALRLAEEGRISIDAVAQNAYSLRVRVRNHTAETLNVSFPPGLVADTYARFALFQVGGGGGTSGGSGGQSTGLLNVQLAPVNGNGVAMLNFQTACLNFGAPEPTPKTVLMIKRVEDFSTDAVFHHLLKELAANPPDEPIAQAALWNVVDKLDWNKLARIRTRRGRFSAEELDEAQSRVSAAQSAAASAAADPETEKKAPKARVPALSVMIHPDPRGRHQDAGLARSAANALRQRWPGVDVSHRDFTPEPKNLAADAVAWCFFVRSVGNAKSPDMQLTPQKSVWIAAKGQWKHESKGPPVHRAPPDDGIGEWLAEAVVQQIAAKSLVVEKKGDDRIVVRNAAPVGLEGIVVTTGGSKGSMLKLKDFALEPGQEKEAALPAAQQERFASAKKISAASFTPTIAKASGG